MTDAIYIPHVDAPERPLYELGQIDREIDELNALIAEKRAVRAELVEAIAQTAAEMGEGFAACGYEVRLNKGRTVTTYDTDKIIPHLTMTQRDTVCTVKYSIIPSVFAAMLNAGKLPAGAAEGVTVTAPQARWEVRKAKDGDK